MTGLPDWMTEDDPRAAAIDEGRLTVEHVQDRRLGARLSTDTRDIPAARAVQLDRPRAATPAYRYYYERFNQNQTGPTCVANTMYHLMGDAPAPTRSITGMEGFGTGSRLVSPGPAADYPSDKPMGDYVSQNSGQRGWRGYLYDQAQLNDEWDDTPPGGGTSGRAGCKVLKASGLISQYVFMDTATEVALAVLNHGPVAIGSWIYDGMYSVSDGDTWAKTGPRIGGHEYLLSGYSTRTRLFRIQTWGMHFKLPHAVLDALLAEGGDAILCTEATA